jgi:aryl-alcohol dehydrogenase-like predicted oxidoreductase
MGKALSTSGTPLASSDDVKRTLLGLSELNISRVGLGTWAIGGGDWILGWGPQDDAQSVATIRRALDGDINWIDTAAVFGLGHAERVVARALRDLRGHRPYLFTRCGLVWDSLGNVAHDLSQASIRRQAEDSLRRLETERIDLYQIGWPVWPETPARWSGSLEEAWETMAALQQEGKVRFIGISNCRTSQLTRLQRIAPVTSLSLPYSLLRRETCDHLDLGSPDAGVLACSTLGSGVLTGTMTAQRLGLLPYNDWRRRHPFFREVALTCARRLVERLRAIARREGQTPSVLAVAWALHHPQVTAAIVGARRPQQVDELVQAASYRFSADDLADLGRPIASKPVPVLAT